MKEVYMVQLDYSTDDCQGVDTYLYDTKEKALLHFYEIIKQEKKDSWIENAFNENGSVNKDYELDTNIDDDNSCDLWWNITCKQDFYLHTFLNLRKMEVKQIWRIYLT